MDGNINSQTGRTTAGLCVNMAVLPKVPTAWSGARVRTHLAESDERHACHRAEERQRDKQARQTSCNRLLGNGWKTTNGRRDG